GGDDEARDEQASPEFPVHLDDPSFGGKGEGVAEGSGDGRADRPNIMTTNSFVNRRAGLADPDRRPIGQGFHGRNTVPVRIGGDSDVTTNGPVERKWTQRRASSDTASRTGSSSTTRSATATVSWPRTPNGRARSSSGTAGPEILGRASRTGSARPR